jgi:asparagine synthase (glutamine-hydrolysing)
LWGSPLPINNDIFAKEIYSGDLNPMQKIVAFDLTTYLPGQLLSKVDRTGMMHSLEVRSPFLDTALAEFVVNLPIEYKVGEGGHKLILKDLLGELMPKEFVNRRKQGFGAPTDKWLREAKMKEYTLEKLGPRAKIRSLFVGKTIDFFLNHFYKSNRNGAGLRIWVLLCLEIWLESVKNIHG